MTCVVKDDSAEVFAKFNDKGTNMEIDSTSLF